MNDRILDWAMKIQSIAQTGLAYCRDEFDRERYTELRELSAEMLAERTELPVGRVRELFCGESGYQTPKLDTRAGDSRGRQNTPRARARRAVGASGRMVRC